MEKILIDYEKIRKNYDATLISTSRGFNNLYDFLDYWVPDENEYDSIINLLQIAKDENIKSLELLISNKIKSSLDINKLENVISTLGKIEKNFITKDFCSNYLIIFEN